MLVDVPPERLEDMAPTLSRELERGHIVRFPRCPVPLPSGEDLEFLRDEVARQLDRKNVSWYPEGDRFVGLDPGPIRDRTQRLLSVHAREVERLLHRLMPAFMRGATLGIASVRPVQEQGRNLSAHASNELLHVDAGAYGATHGDRILRFFVNTNPVEDRVWISRGSFAQLYLRYGAAAGCPPVPRSLQPALPERLWSGFLRRASAAAPSLKMIDSSPYDRLMRRFHNFMKDDPAFRASTDGLVQMAFAPYSAWMVLTDAVSHACISGQHALVETFLVPRANCTERSEAPWELLSGTVSS
jgi:hypothetical protein